MDADVADAVTEENLEEGIAFAKAFAKKAGCIVAITGAIDLVSDGASCYIIRNGRQHSWQRIRSRSWRRQRQLSARWDWQERLDGDICRKVMVMPLTVTVLLMQSTIWIKKH